MQCKSDAPVNIQNNTIIQNTNLATPRPYKTLMWDLLSDIKICLWLPEIILHHDDVIKWKHFPRYWPFVRGIHRSPVTQKPVTRSFDVFFVLRPNKRLSKQSWGWWFEMPSRPLWRHRNDIQMIGRSRCFNVAHFVGSLFSGTIHAIISRCGFHNEKLWHVFYTCICYHTFFTDIQFIANNVIPLEREFGIQ